MSCTTFAVYVSGLKVSLADKQFQMPNPAFGKTKFDPETGQKNEKFIINEKLRDSITGFLEKYEVGNSTKYRNSFRCGEDDYEQGYYGVIYMALDGEVVKIHKEFPPMPKNYGAFIEMLKKNNIPYEEGNFLINYISC